MRRACLPLALLALVVLASARHSVPLTRSPNRLHKSFSEIPAFLNKYRSPTGAPTGSSIPMKGGLLTVGAYFAEIQVGTPAVSHTVLVDTGSSNLVLPGVDCLSCGNTKLYNYTASSTAAPIPCNSPQCLACSPPGWYNTTSRCILGQKPFCYADAKLSNPCGFAITYGGGSSGITGGYSVDNVCMGPFCLAGHNLGVIERSDPPGNMGPGLIGFAWEYNACNPSCPTVFFDDVVQKYNIPGVFGMCLTPSKGGVLDLGLIDSNKYTGTIQYAPLVTPRWWNIEVQDVTVGGFSIQVPPYLYSMTNDVIGSFVDSGTSVILMSPTAFSYFQHMFQAQFWMLPGVGNASHPNAPSLFTGECIPQEKINLSKFPPISFAVTGENGAVIQLPVPPTSYLLLQNGCYSLGVGSAIGVGLVLGDVFMESYYVVFDRANSRLGFADVATCV